MSKNDELVLGIPRRDLMRICPELPAQGVTPLRADILDTILRESTFRRRGDCEDDPAFKQLIVYPVAHFTDRLWLTYTRGGDSAEERLKARISVGVGGHINPEDLGGESRPREYHMVLACLREFDEEIAMRQPHTRFLDREVRFLVNDDADEDTPPGSGRAPVGRVHVGLVYALRLITPIGRGSGLPEFAPAEGGGIAEAYLGEPGLIERLPALERWSAILVSNADFRSSIVAY